MPVPSPSPHQPTNSSEQVGLFRAAGANRAQIRNGSPENLNDARAAVPVALTRGEMSTLFACSEKSIARWEAVLSLPVERKNARVLRYGEAAIVEILRRGRSLDRAAAARLGLDCDYLLARADSDRESQVSPADATAIGFLTARTPDEQLLLELARQPGKGALLIRLAKALYEPSDGNDSQKTVA